MGISKMSLLYLALQKVYHKCVNACINFTKDVFGTVPVTNFKGVGSKTTSKTIAIFAGLKKRIVKRALKRLKKTY